MLSSAGILDICCVKSNPVSYNRCKLTRDNASEAVQCAHVRVPEKQFLNLKIMYACLSQRLRDLILDAIE